MITRKSTLILFFVLIIFFVGCEAEKENYNHYSKNICSVYIECDNLDAIFSKLLEDNKNAKKFYIKNYIINSKEELDAINSLGLDVDCIDFSKYTLFGSIIFNDNHIQMFNINLDLLVNGTEISIDSTYYFKMTICEDENHYEPVKSAYKWILYPKFADGIEIMASFKKTNQCGV